MSTGSLRALRFGHMPCSCTAFGGTDTVLTGPHDLPALGPTAHALMWWWRWTDVSMQHANNSACIRLHLPALQQQQQQQ